MLCVSVGQEEQLTALNSVVTGIDQKHSAKEFTGPAHAAHLFYSFKNHHLARQRLRFQPHRSRRKRILTPDVRY